MKQLTPTTRNYPQDVTIIEVDGREFIIIGTAHVSQESAALVRQVISQEQPNCVCVELDPQRYKTLIEKNKWENLNLKEVIRRKQLTTLLVNLLLSAYQKKLGQGLGILPGAELLEATKAAQEFDIPIALCDRDVRITLRRAWYSMSFWEKMKLLSSGLIGMFESPELSEEMLAEMRQTDVLSEMMKELGQFLPVLKMVLIDERDTYIAQKTRAATGQRIVSVVGAGHVEGICHALRTRSERDLSEVEEIPQTSFLWKVVGWGIPVIILGAIAYIGYSQGLNAAGENVILWVLANGIPSAIGTALALGHPITILTAFVAAPLTSLTPVIGAGYVTAFVQVYLQPPKIKELQSVGEDINHVKKWWQNRLLRVFLVFILSGLGSLIGTYVGAYGILSNMVGVGG
ncbi:TraB/GumN family protein [Anaerolineales bacterium HSG24]|nr:TraB/GumN family protein [Anaerolineales bacterium HSG24]